MKNKEEQMPIPLSFPGESENYLKKKREQILAAGDPSQAVRGLSPPDYFYIIRTADPEEALVLLESGTTEQWEHLLDLEIWERDRLSITRLGRWLKWMQRAHGTQLARWLVSDGAELGLFYFSRVLDIHYRGTEEEPSAIPEDFFTLDGTFFF